MIAQFWKNVYKYFKARFNGDLIIFGFSLLCSLIAPQWIHTHTISICQLSFFMHSFISILYFYSKLRCIWHLQHVSCTPTLTVYHHLPPPLVRFAVSFVDVCRKCVDFLSCHETHKHTHTYIFALTCFGVTFVRQLNVMKKVRLRNDVGVCQCYAIEDSLLLSTFATRQLVNVAVSESINTPHQSIWWRA